MSNYFVYVNIDSKICKEEEQKKNLLLSFKFLRVCFYFLNYGEFVIGTIEVFFSPAFIPGFSIHTSHRNKCLNINNDRLGLVT